MIKPLHQIGSTSVALIDHQFSIKAHPFLKAKICLLPNRGTTFSADPGNQFGELSNPDFQLISFREK